MEVSAVDRVRIQRRAFAIGLAVAPFGLAFGVLCAEAGLSALQAAAFSVFVFAGSSQLAAVGVLVDGGTAAAAVAAGLLLNVRSIAFGIAVAPALRGPWWWRAAVSQLVIDESTAVGTAERDLPGVRYGFLAGGISVFVLWNAATLLGVTLVGGLGDMLLSLGVDAAIPASFLALLAGRLGTLDERVTAAAGAVLAFALVPIAPPGIPILAAALGAVPAVLRRAPVHR